TSESSANVPPGQVVGTQPAAGSQAARDATITIIVSTGPKQVTVPDVTGQTEGAATSALQNAGLKVTVLTITSPGNAGKVISQNPGAGTSVTVGSTVTINV